MQIATPAATESTVVVAGYGYVGRAICAMLERVKITYTAFEIDPECLAKAEKSKHNVRYGDVPDPTMMGAIAIARARLVIVTTRSFESTKRMIGNLRHFYPQVMVVTAVQYLVQRDELRRMGATHVVALAPEGVLSFGSSVLDRLGVVHDQTEAIVKALKSDDYAALRGVGGTEPETAKAGAAIA